MSTGIIQWCIPFGFPRWIRGLNWTSRVLPSGQTVCTDMFQISGKSGRCFEEVLACPAEVLHHQLIDMVQRSDNIPNIPALYVPSIFGLLGLFLQPGLRTLKVKAVV